MSSLPADRAPAAPPAHRAAIRAHFDRISADYPALKSRNRYYHDFLIRWCRAMVPPGRRVLDVGCGHGDALAAVAPADGVGVDVSPAMAAAASAAHPNLRFIASPVEALPAGDP